MPPIANRNRLNRWVGYLVIALVTVAVLWMGAQRRAGDAMVTRKTQLDENVYHKLAGPSAAEQYREPKEKAAFVTLVRNSDLYSLLPSIKSVEDRFNHKFGYDWVFLNDEAFTDEFIEATSALVSGKTKYGQIDPQHWGFPPWIDQEKAAATREQMTEDGIIYGGSVSYRFMCRFESGLFFRHPLLDDYEWYWRVEPDIKLSCDIDYDVFRFMRENGKRYGFTISIKEYEATIKTLWNVTLDFITQHPEYVHKNSMLDFVSDDGGYSYNLCHFWSNFEIGSLAMWREPAYSAYFDFLDHAGGFFYERWGDAPVHSIAAALFLDRDEIHHFGDLGYYHVPFHQCPVDDAVRLSNKCDCDPNKDFTWESYSCTSKYYTVNHLRKPASWMKHAT